MNKKQLLKLDAWIAEHVMNFQEQWMASIKTHGVYFPRKGQCGVFWHPTTSRADAMEVLEKCAERGKASEHNVVIYQPVGQEGGKWAVGAEFAVEADELDCEYAKTLPLAICLFAKKLFVEKDCKALAQR